MISQYMQDLLKQDDETSLTIQFAPALGGWVVEWTDIGFSFDPVHTTNSQDLQEALDGMDKLLREGF